MSDIIDAKTQSLYEEVVQIAVKLKRGKETVNGGGTGHYSPEGYKDRGLIGVFTQLDKKHKSLEQMIWGPNQFKPTQDIDELTLGQMKKMFDHAIDSGNYYMFLTEMVVEYVRERFGVDLLEEMADGRELA